MSQPAPQSAGIATMLRETGKMLAQTVNDFSDADVMVRPVPKANHAAWQLAHIASFEAQVLGIIAPGKKAELPANYAERAKDHTSDDPAAFGSKAQLVANFTKTREALADAAAQLSAEQLKAATPPDLQGLAPNVEQLLSMVPFHATMHMGQLQVIRRKLDKPFLFTS